MRDKLRLVLLSFLMLFVELFLIRWVGANVVYLSYFSNFVLLGSFLGIGVGFLRARASRNLFPVAPVALTALVLFVFVFPVEINRSGGELIYFGTFTATGLPTWATLPAIFFAVAAVMAMIAEGVARQFVFFEPLEAYRLDILGSIAGIAAFSLMSLAAAPPVAWGVAIGLGFLLVSPRVTYLQGVAIVGLTLVLAVQSLNPFESWSPYYRVTASELSGTPDPVIDVKVNGIPHQMIESSARRQATEPIYFLPYDRLASGQLDDVLVVGAGSGSDVAIALAHQAGRVDAVEIDPLLYELGARLHPDRPYDDPRVDVHIDDARAFLERTDRSYDLVLFALPDSLTLVSGQSSLRLESYLFTSEAMAEAREHLKPGGLFAMYNYYREPWLIDRLALTLEKAYGHPPCLDAVGGAAHMALLSIGRDIEAVSCETPWDPVARAVAKPATDDYPFVYLRDRGIPGFYLVVISLILVASALSVRLAGGPIRPMTSYADLFFMGAAFLLLETKNIVQFALLFGTTWLVNSLVFCGILVCVLVAVEVSRRFRLPKPTRLYWMLFAALALAWLVPPQELLALPLLARFATATLLAFTPILLANLIFAERFKNAESSATAFGANLLGAMVGGLLEYGALVTGYRGLLVVTATLYGLAFVVGRGFVVARASQTSPAARPATLST